MWNSCRPSSKPSLIVKHRTGSSAYFNTDIRRFSINTPIEGILFMIASILLMLIANSVGDMLSS